MKRKKTSSYEDNIHISVNGVRVDKIKLKMAPFLNKDGNYSPCSLGIGHNIKANINENLLFIKIPPKITVQLFMDKTLIADKEFEYDFEIFDWKAKCLLKDIIYSEINSHDENIMMIFSIINESGDNSSLRMIS